MNLIITDACNRSCPYCFAKSKVKLGQSDTSGNAIHMSLENVKIFLDFLVKSKRPSFKILGGEPSIHPKFPEIVQMGLSKGLRVQVFSNGLWPAKIVDYVKTLDPSKIDFIININEPSAENEKEQATLHRTLEAAGPMCRAGFNIYREDFSMLFLADLIEKYSMQKDIRIGLANPIAGASNEYLGVESLKKVGKRLVGQLEELEKKGSLGLLDCGFTFCMFDKEGHGSLAYTTKQEVSTSQCGMAIDVGPDLSLWPCFPLSDVLNVKMTDFKDSEEIVAFYNSKLDSLRPFGCMDKCFNCNKLERGQCKVCLARIMRSWEEKGDKSLIEKLNNLVSA